VGRAYGTLLLAFDIIRARDQHHTWHKCTLPTNPSSLVVATEQMLMGTTNMNVPAMGLLSVGLVNVSLSIIMEGLMVEQHMPQPEVDRRIMQVVVSLSESMVPKLFWSMFTLRSGLHATSLEWLGANCGVTGMYATAGATTLLWDDAITLAVQCLVHQGVLEYALATHDRQHDYSTQKWSLAHAAALFPDPAVLRAVLKVLPRIGTIHAAASADVGMDAASDKRFRRLDAGTSPLHVAAIENHHRLIKPLIEHGCVSP
jgi:hypothetical protein